MTLDNYQKHTCDFLQALGNNRTWPFKPPHATKLRISEILIIFLHRGSYVLRKFSRTLSVHFLHKVLSKILLARVSQKLGPRKFLVSHCWFLTPRVPRWTPGVRGQHSVPCDDGPWPSSPIGLLQRAAGNGPKPWRWMCNRLANPSWRMFLFRCSFHCFNSRCPLWGQIRAWFDNVPLCSGSR